MVNFYEGRINRSPFLGLQEGETRKQCPPGQVLSNLPDFPWSECIPEEEAYGGSAPPAPQAPPPAPKPALPIPPPEPRRARFLSVDPATGDFVDPDTGAVIETASAYSLDVKETVAIGAGLGILAALFALTGVFD